MLSTFYIANISATQHEPGDDGALAGGFGGSAFNGTLLRSREAILLLLPCTLSREPGRASGSVIWPVDLDGVSRRGSPGMRSPTGSRDAPPLRCCPEQRFDMGTPEPFRTKAWP